MSTPQVTLDHAAFGSGLTFAAVFDTCAMGMAPSRLPWNRGAVEVDIDDALGSLAAHA